MAQIFLKALNRLTQCCTAEFLLNPNTARTVADTPVIKITPVAHTGISKMVSKDRLNTSNNDSFLVNLPPSDAVSNIKPLAPKPAKA